MLRSVVARLGQSRDQVDIDMEGPVHITGTVTVMTALCSDLVHSTAG